MIPAGLKLFWRYWTFMCGIIIALALLWGLIYILLGPTKAPEGGVDAAQKCLDQGGSWNADAGQCRFAG